MNTESRAIIITRPTSDCPRTGLPRVARMRRQDLSDNGAIILNYTVDVLDNNNEVFVRGEEMKTIQFLPHPINGPNGMEETPYLPEHAALVAAIRTPLENLLDTININPEEEPSEEEE